MKTSPGHQALAYVRQYVGYASAIVNEIYGIEQTGVLMGKSRDQIEEALARRNLSSRLADRLTDGANALCIALDILALTATRKTFRSRWRELKKEELGEVEWWHTDEDNGLESKPLTLIREFLLPLEAAYGDDASGQLKAGLATLEYVLTCSPRILASLAVNPTREADVQGAMDQHLENVFADYAKGSGVTKPLRNFKFDGSVLSLAAAIEYKFVSTKEKLSVAIAGINEDFSGYAGSSDWRHFYSVVYQTQPFTNDKQFEAALGASGNAGFWKFIVVTG
jgi:hypothetical protein